MKYAHLNKDGQLLGWYDDSIHKTIPTPNIQVSDEIWKEAININANCYEDGEFIVKDFRTVEEIEAENLQNKINEADMYLKQTDWVNDYKTRHDLGLELIPETSSKWEIINKRAEARQFIRDNEQWKLS